MSEALNDLNLKIYVAGHRGMVGSAIVRELGSQGYKNIVTRTHDELDLINQKAVQDFFNSEKPDVVYLAAAKVGGIHANNIYPADFIFQNLMIQTNVIHYSFLNGVKRLLFLGSSCIYPKMAKQPIKEESLLTGQLEPTNEPYAIAKIAGVKMVESYNRQYGVSNGINYRSVMPTNLYGPGDNYHPENSHVIPGLIQRIHQAKIKKEASVVIWGSGSARREFLYVDDMAKASVYFMNLNNQNMSESTSKINLINIGYGSDILIKDLAYLIKDIVQFRGEIVFDHKKPDGTPVKLMDSSYIFSKGFKPKTDLSLGLKKTYLDYLKNHV